MSWHDRAACDGMKSYPFFSLRDDDGETKAERDSRISEARSICAFCPVREECRVEGARQPGIWGGLTQDERRSGTRFEDVYGGAMPSNGRGGYRYFTPEEVEEVVRLYVGEGWSLRQVAEKVNATWSGVRRVLVRQGIPLHDRRYVRRQDSAERQRQRAEAVRAVLAELGVKA